MNSTTVYDKVDIVPAKLVHTYTCANCLVVLQTHWIYCACCGRKIEWGKAKR